MLNITNMHFNTNPVTHWMQKEIYPKNGSTLAHEIQNVKTWRYYASDQKAFDAVGYISGQDRQDDSTTEKHTYVKTSNHVFMEAQDKFRT
jgi:hypothetical protein